MPLESVEVTTLPPERFAEVLTPNGLAAFQHSIARGNELLGSHAIWNVNSTAFGGGVAEMLRSLIGYVRGAGLDGRWVVVEGDAEFFRLTKRLHNRLHGAPGDGGPLGEAERIAYERRCAANAAALVEMLRPGDIVILHDPQTAGMLPALRAAVDVPVIWRAHIGLDLPNDTRARGLELPDALPRGRRRVRVLARGVHVGGPRPCTGERHPAVDRRLLAEEPRDAVHQRHRGAARRRPGRRRAPPHRAVFERLDGSVGYVERRAQMVEEEELGLDSPLLAQVSRWDALKDPLGVLAAFAEHVHAEQRAAPAAGGPGRPRRRGRPGGRRRSSPRPRPPGTSCRRTCAAASTWRCCRWTTPKRTP